MVDNSRINPFCTVIWRSKKNVASFIQYCNFIDNCKQFFSFAKLVFYMLKKVKLCQSLPTNTASVLLTIAWNKEQLLVTYPSFQGWSFNIICCTLKKTSHNPVLTVWSIKVSRREEKVVVVYCLTQTRTNSHSKVQFYENILSRRLLIITSQ
jgi:hypothetical protein